MNKMPTASTAKLSVWTEPRKSGDPELDGLSLMERLWNQLDGMFLSRWKGQFDSEVAVSNWRNSWALAFAEEGLTPQDIAVGLTAMRRAKYPPSLADFLEACRPVLTPEDAYHEAIRELAKRRAPVLRGGAMVTDDKWSEPAIYWAAISMESDLQMQPYERIKGRWARALDYARKHPKGAVPEYLLELPAKSVVPLSEAEQLAAEAKQRQTISEILSTLGKRSPEAAPASRKMKALSDDDLTARKAALDELLAAKQQREGQQGEGENAEQGRKRVA